MASREPPAAALVAWVAGALGVPADAAEANAVATRLAREDFGSASDACSEFGPTASDLAELLPGQTATQTALLQAIRTRRALEDWLRDQLPPGAAHSPSACADRLASEDFNSFDDLSSAGLTPADMADLFPGDPLVASRLLEALRDSDGDGDSDSGATAPATSPVADDDGSIHAWLRARLPSIDAAACARTFQSEGFVSVDDVLTTGLTRADLEELFPGDLSTVTQLLSLLSAQGSRETLNPTPTVGSKAGPNKIPKPQQATSTPMDATTLTLPSKELVGRPPVGARIIVMFEDSTYRGRVISHCTGNGVGTGEGSHGRFDCYFEADEETWTLDSEHHQYCLDVPAAPAVAPAAAVAAATAAQSSSKRKKPSDSSSADDEPLRFGNKRHKARVVPEARESPPTHGSSPSDEPSVHKIICLHAPLYEGCESTLLSALSLLMLVPYRLCPGPCDPIVSHRIPQRPPLISRTTVTVMVWLSG